VRRFRGPLLLGLGLVLVAAGLWRGEMEQVRRTSTYRDFDVAADQSGVQYLTPGVPDRANEGAYSFDRIHTFPLIAIGIVFVSFFALRNLFSIDGKLGLLSRGVIQWSAFAAARLGVFRVSGVARVPRCSAGVFPFLNCQACEMATGACPVGQIQISMLHGSVPLFAAGVIVATVALFGRVICGWACPFGLFSDIMDRFSLRRGGPGHRWRAGGFVVAVLVFVGVGVFALAGITRFAPFCSTLCASGKLYGLLPYYATTAAGDVGSSEGLAVFVFHSALFALLIIAMIAISGRVFCRYMCPLGAVLGLGNKIAAIRIEHHADACTGCDLCVGKCPMDIDLARDDFLTQASCIRCGRCVAICKQGARTWEYPFARALGRTAHEPSHAPHAPVAQG